MLKGALADPVGFIRAIDRAVIDEVQRAPDLLLAIKQSVDEDRRHGRFLLTVSAHILALPKVKESLAGRMEVVTLYPLSRSEVVGSGLSGFIDIAFSGEVPRPSERISGADLMSVVVAGGYPEVLARTTERRRRDWCRSYLDAIVERDVRDIATVDKTGELRKLIEVMAQVSGQLTNLSEIGGMSFHLDRKCSRFRFQAYGERAVAYRRWNAQGGGGCYRIPKKIPMKSEASNAPGRVRRSGDLREIGALAVPYR